MGKTMILDTRKEDSKKKELLDSFFNSAQKKYIYGTNDVAKQLASLTTVEGFINNFTKETSFLDKPIFSADSIERDSIIVSCSLSMYPISTLHLLKKLNFKNILTILDIAYYSKFNIGFINDAKKDIELNFDKYENIYNQFIDSHSKNTFKNILNFRKNFDLNYMSTYRVDEKGQYFENFLRLNKGEVFIDAGGFDGQTSIEFIKHCPQYKSIYIFEPDKVNIKLAERNLNKYKYINFITKGLSNKNTLLKFNTGAGSSSSISNNGSIEIEVNTLDNLVKEKITFIKMDIEGAESLAIEGMKNHILNDHPKMAISVYHKVDDLWKIPEQILTIRKDYDIYVRHYTEGTDETVMFFIPQ
jgi:FkbM family methyltransferase